MPTQAMKSIHRSTRLFVFFLLLGGLLHWNAYTDCL